MHESMQRLLAFAREVTADSREPIHSSTDLGRRLGKSSAVMTNWKARGVSMQGAVEASAVLGVSPRWVLTGEGDAADATAGGVPLSAVMSDVPGSAPAPSGGKAVSNSDWGVLQDLALLMPSERDEWVAQLHQRAERAREDFKRFFTERGLPIPPLEAGVGNQLPMAPRHPDSKQPDSKPDGDRLLGGASKLGGLDELPSAAPSVARKRARS